MIIYIPSSAAELLSSEIWSLTRPPPVQGGNATKYLFGWIDDVVGQRWIEVHDDCSIVIHLDADIGGIADILQPWIDAGKLPADTGTQLATLLDSKRGQRVVVYDVFPQLFKDMAKTHEQLVEAGLLADIDEQ
jgi:hypothetical protein